ncbi:flagellin [Comamonas thiooxydans]|uniref:flagellin n=1 Tax=Comamonas thiooxydans TaxID=363952 RepID=UPI003EEA557D
MAAIINTNIQSLNAQRNLAASQNSLATSMQRLSSGLRINSSKDDAAGLAISERMSTQVRGLTVAARNANDGISLAQTAEGAMASLANNLQRMRELAVQSANATNSAGDRAALQEEVAQLRSEIDRVATQTEFNGTKLLDGSFNNLAFQVGANAGQTIVVDTMVNARASAMGQFSGFDEKNVSIGTASNTPSAKSITVGTAAPIALGTIANDAKAIAAALNNSGVPGLSATSGVTKVPSVAVTDPSTVAPGSVSVKINGVTVNIAATQNGTTNVANAMVAINAMSAATGVVASQDGQGLTFTAADGRNIDISGFNDTDTTGATLASFGIAPEAVTGASLDYRYDRPVGVTAATIAISGSGPALSSRAVAATGTAISAVDVSTVDGANTAIRAIDVALSTINSSRAALGAVQNRFASTIENLQTTSENLSASRSRIMDADFAVETANLSRSQILQQAGTAMVAQANQLPQSVLKLLQG